MKSKSLFTFGLITFCILFTVTINIYGKDNETTTEKIKNLEKQMSELNSKVSELEKKLEDYITTSQSALPSVPAGKDAWRKLNKRMSREQVKNLLGEPDKIDTYEFFEIWHYNNYSEVEFNTSGHVIGWREPN